MYTATVFKNFGFFERFFPNVKLTSVMQENIKKIRFLAFQSTAGFKVRKHLLLKKLKENGIPISEHTVHSADIMLTDEEAEEVGLSG